MAFHELIRAGVSLALVAGMIWLTAWVLKRYGIDKKLSGLRGTMHGRLQVVDALHVDTKRKLMLVRADKKEYLLLLSADNAILLDSISNEGAADARVTTGRQMPANAQKESE